MPWSRCNPDSEIVFKAAVEKGAQIVSRRHYNE